MKNIEVIRTFVNGGTKAKTKNLHIDGDKLINYNTCIAVRKSGNIVINNKKYSVTTSKIQNMLRREIPSYKVQEVETEEAVLKILKQRALA